MVVLEGPASVAAVAERVANASADLSYVMRGMAEDARAGDTSRRAEGSALAAERERALYEVVREFRLVARAAIGQAV
ncbi:hypothetical protein KME66_13735 [Streptomyces sp. YPW6]|uniref:hypothetical protein n=1 Tax=Streptomyces sp. YPW6 TaxID=2840373 RepID=UPI001C0BAEE0|nr:hypothetical protein [Streptomyces sp. YPW6]QWQ41946.1 hypothetical protein KME66_13735 [Streptomyces sp. YPW6]